MTLPLGAVAAVAAGPPATVPYPAISGPTLVAQGAPVNPFAATMAPNNMNIGDPSLPSARASRDSFNSYPAPPSQQPQQPPFGQPPPGTGPVSEPQPGGFGMPAHGTGTMPRYPTQPRLFAPVAQGQGTVTSQALGRRPPMWVVAVGSGLAALFVAGIVFVVLTQLVFSSPPKKVTGKSASSAAAPLVTAPTPVPVPGLPAGPFQAARAGFLLALASQGPTSMTAPTPPPTPAATATVAPASAPDPQPTAVAVADTRPPTAAPAAAPQLAQPTYSQPQPERRRAAPVSDSQAQGQLSVICLPGCDQVFDNGKPLGGAPFFKRPVSVGSHRLRLQNAGSVKVVSVSVVVDQVTTVRESMTP